MILDAYTSQYAAYVLAGGASSRMGTDKASLRLGNLTLVEHALQLLRSVRLEAFIVGSRDDLSAYGEVVPDLRPGCGPLSGIEAGLQHAARRGKAKALFLPVDLPLLPTAFLRQMIDRACLTDALATVPRFLGHEQPLCAIYDCALLPAISLAIDTGDYKVMRVIRQATAASLDCFDVETTLAAGGDHSGWPAATHRMFLNCNTPKDFHSAEFYLHAQQVQ